MRKFSTSSGLSKVVKSEALEVIEQKLKNNVYAAVSRGSPNGPLLKDGAV